MKTKPHSHKNQNTFRFQTFTEQLAQINVNVSHFVGVTSQNPEDADTFFHETLIKWDELNCTEYYSRFKEDLNCDFQTLPQLILNKDIIIECLKKHLNLEGSLTYPPLLELVVALSRDLQKDFYLYFYDFFEIFMKLLQNKNAEVIEHVFKSIAYLFKFLCRYMVNDFNKIYSLYSGLLDGTHPTYIKSFAAESIAYLLRKIPSKESMLNTIFLSVQDNAELCEGVGLLLFECVKNVQNRFHSCCENILYLILNKLGSGMGFNQVSSWDDIVSCEVKMVTAMMEYTTPKFSSAVFDTFNKILKDLFALYDNDSGDNRRQISEHISRVLQVLYVAVSFQNARFMCWSTEFEKILLKSLNNEDEMFLKECGEHIANIAIEIILSPHTGLSLPSKTNIINEIYGSLFSWDVKWHITKSLLSLESFNQEILPLYFCICDELLGESGCDRKEDILTSMAELIIHLSPPPLTGSEFLNFTPIMLDCYRSKTSKFGTNILNYLEATLKLQDSVDFDKHIPAVWAAVVCIAHFRFHCHSLLGTRLRDLCSILFKSAILKNEIKDDEIFLLFYTFLTMIIITEVEEMEERLSIVDIENLLKRNFSNVFCLRIVELYITFMKRHKIEHCYNGNVLKTIFPLLELNISSPYEEVRKASLRILNIFKYEMPSVLSDAEKKSNVFEICLKAENTDLTMEEYRERLRFLRLLEYKHILPCIPVGGFETVPLHYLIGTFFVPFELLWEPAIELISSYAQEMNVKVFWGIYLRHLKESAEIAEKHLAENVVSNKCSKAKEEVRRLFDDCREKYGNLPARIDYINHRKLLWKSMLKFTTLCENRNRDLSTLFLSFISNEYNRVEDALLQDVSCRNSNLQESETSVVEPDLVDSEEEKNEEIMALEETKSKKLSSKRITLILCSHLTLFSKFTNPKSVFREHELKKLYFNLLAHPNPGLQKLALDCIMGYKYDFLKPYKDNLYRLLDNHNYKTELVAFNIDSDVSVVQEEHRLSLLPYLMRILYGVMQKKQGLKSGKASLNSRRRAILQYLAKSREEEFKIFLNLVFDHLFESSVIEGDILTMVEGIFSRLDVSNVLSLRKIERNLRFLETIFKEFGGRISTHLSWLFKILMCLTATVSALNDNRNNVNPNCWKHLRNLRKLSMQRIIQFFDIFDNHPFTREEIDALFIACIWPQLKNFRQDNVRTCSHILTLFSHWSENPRYFPLLAKHAKNCQTLSPLHQMMELLENTASDKSVVTVVLNIVKNLVTMADYTSESDPFGGLLEVNDEFPVSDYMSNYEDWQIKPNYGSIILLPHISPILMCLERLISTMGGNGVKGAIPVTNLTILNRLSEFIKDGNYCATLVKILIPFLTRKLKRDEETEINIFLTIIHLLKVTENPAQFVVPLSILFSSLENRGSRVALCKAFDVVSERDETNLSCSSIANKLNAWEPKRPEEPEYTLRMEGFNQAQNIELIDSSNPSLLLVAIYNCCYSIKFVNDLGIRTNASVSLQSLASKFNRLDEKDIPAASRTFLSPLLAEIKKGLRSKTENVRHEFITILAEFSKECTKYHQFKYLRLLTHEEADVDFFKNITHIQMQRRSRTLSRIIHGDLLQHLNQETITQYIMPMVSVFLFNESYQKLNYLIDSTIELIGCICHYLDWNMYVKILTQYLAKITDNTEFQKVAVTAVVKILDSFHFDLTVLGNGNVDKLIEPPLKEPLKLEDEDKDLEVCDGNKEMKEAQMEVGNTDKISVEKASKIYNTVTKSILPQLHQCLTRKAATDDVHHLAQRCNSDDDETLRVPVAIAMVKLLQRLPKGILDTHLPSILMKLCTFLKSRHEGIRQVARNTLITVMDSLGVKYLPYVIKEMRQLLTRGYQVHSMTYTMHALLRHLMPKFKPGALDHSIKNLIEVFREELFGVVSEEKEVQQIVGKLVEAKGTKAYDAYEIMAQFISGSHLNDLTSCLKEILDETTNHKVVTKVKECLKRVILGLVENKALSFKDILIFAHRFVQEGLDSAKIVIPKPTLVEENIVTSKPSIYIIPAEPRRNKMAAPKSSRTNEHVLSDFGLEVLYFGLKRGKIDTTSKAVLEMLDPFLDLIVEHLSSPHVELVTSSLKILPWLVDLDLPSLSRLADDITRTLFAVLKTYTRVKNRQTNNSGDVVSCCFKAIRNLIRSGKNSTMRPEHMKLLLIYIEKDILDSSKQAEAFNMLKTIFSKKLFMTEVKHLVQKIREMSITSGYEHVRNQCRQCVLMYMLNYPLVGKMDVHLQFFASQWEYEHETGRSSAMDMLILIFTNFRKDILDSNADSLFTTLAFAIINDASESCRKKAAEALKTLLTYISDSVKDQLFSMTELWITTKKLGVSRVGCQVCGIFVDLEKEEFQRRLPTVLSKLVADVQLRNQEEIDIEQKKFDHLLVTKLHTLLSILKETKIVCSSTYKDDLEKLWEFTKTLLLHSHTWVRLIASQIFGVFFAAYSVDDAAGIIKSKKQNKGFFFKDFPKSIKSLVNGFFRQLESAVSVSEIKEQVAENMIYLATLVTNLPENVLKIPVTLLHNEEDGQNVDFMVLSISWFIKRFLKEVKNEVTNNPRVTVRRSCYFSWVEKMSATLDKEQLISHLNVILPPLLREITVEHFGDEALKEKAGQLIEQIKNIVGIQIFSQHYAQVQRATSEKHSKRKADAAAMAVLNPQLAAKKKMKKHLAKTVAKKRKIEAFNKGHGIKRQKKM